MAHPGTALYLSPADLAETLGLSVSTLKRWTDKGLLRVERTAGRHRRIAIAEALRFVRDSGLKPVMPHRLGLAAADAEFPAGITSSPAQFEHLLVSGRTDAARRFLVSAFVSGEAASVLGDSWVRPACESVGELWKKGDDGIAVEHQATETVLRAIAEMRALIEPVAEAPAAIGSSVAGDPYLIPSALADLVLAVSGFRSTNLGADLPRAALLSAIQRMKPRLVWVSVSVQDAEGGKRPALERLATDVAALGAAVVIGGRGAPDRVTGATVGRDLAGLGAFGRGLLS